MAISASPDWSLPSFHGRRFTHHFPSKTLTFLSATRRLHHRAASRSPILEQPSTTTKPGPKPEPRQPAFPASNGFSIRTFQDPRRTEELAFKYYRRSKGTPDFRPEKSVLSKIIRYLTTRSRSNWNFVLLLCSDFTKYGVLPDPYSYGRLVRHCVRGRKFRVARVLLEISKSDSKVAVLAFDAAMRGYNKLHMYSSCVAVFEEMKSAGIAPDSGCYLRIMEANEELGNVDRVLGLFREFVDGGSKGSNSTPFIGRIYKVLCESLGKSGRAFEALDYFREARSKGIAIDPSIYSSLISSFASINEVKMAEELFKEVEGRGILRDPAVCLKVVLLYVEKGLMEKTLDVVKAMRAAKLHVSDCVFCAIVNGFSKKRGFWAAVKVYQELTSQGIQPGQVTYASILNIYCRIKLYVKAEKVFSEMVEKGFDKCVVAYSTIVAMYGKMGRLRDAMRLVAKMKERGCEPNVWIYNSLLDMHGRANNVKQVEKIWKEMKRRRIVPDKVSYTSIITAYNKGRDFEACIRYYEEYRTHGGTIDKVMAGIMVGVFNKVSRIDALLKLLGDMKSEKTPIDERLHRSAQNALRDAGLQMYSRQWLQESFEAT